MDLPHDIALYLLLLAAIGAGYWVGRKDRKRPRPQQAVIKDYYQGLNFLLGDKPELGVDRFIDAEHDHWAAIWTSGNTESHGLGLAMAEELRYDGGG